MGCYWACPITIKVFDFTNPLALPLEEIKEIRLISNDEIITGWADNETVLTKGIKREYEEMVFEDGSWERGLVAETTVESA